MRTVVVRNGTRIPLGKQGENKAVRIVWPEIAEKYTKLYGDGRFELVVVQKGQAYPAVVNVDGPDLIWNVLAADVAIAEVGSLELIYYVGDTIAKSQTWETFVEVSKSAEGTAEPPEPAKNWVDAVLKSSSDAKQSATESAESAKQAAESREAIENMEAAAVSLPPNSKATVEKDLVEGKVKLTFGIPRGESDIFWLNTDSSSTIVETFDEILAAHKAGKSIWIRDTNTFDDNVATVQAYLVRPLEDDDETDIIGMFIICGGSARGSSEIGAIDALLNVTYYIFASPEDVTFEYRTSVVAELGLGYYPNESQLNGSAGNSMFASSQDHVHPAPFPYWKNNIGKALFVNNANETPSQAFEWRDVPNGDFTSKVGDFLKVAEVDSNNKPTKWTTDSVGGIKEPMVVTFTLKDPSTFSFKSDTLYDDIKEAADAGRIVYAFAPASSGGPLFARLVDARSTLVFSGQTNIGAVMIIKMSSDSDIVGTGINLLYCRDKIFGGGDFNAEKRRIKDVEEPTDDSDAATKGYVDKSLGSSDLSLGLTAAKVGQTIKVKAIDADGKPTEWEAVDAASGTETWELIAEIDVDVDAANDVFVWEYKNLPNYKELLYRKVSLVGSTETNSGITISINNSLPQYSGMAYSKKGGQYSGWGKILAFPFGWVHVCFPYANSPTNYAMGGLSTMYNAIPFDGGSITSVKLSAHTTYKIAGGKISLYGRR